MDVFLPGKDIKKIFFVVLLPYGFYFDIHFQKIWADYLPLRIENIVIIK